MVGEVAPTRSSSGQSSRGEPGQPTAAVPNRAETEAASFEHHETVANAKAAAKEL